ncbi:MAG: hypothetical protein IT258_08085 [Saprospiraceae bacterium]|nr:hypothetical protein [Saprospiraceae bacterium]
MTIVADFDSIKANIKNKNYVQGQILIDHGKDAQTILKTKLRPRGKSRRMMCEFPPLKLKLDKMSLADNRLHPFNDFKLVTHCKSSDPKVEAVIQREFLIYKLFNALTPFSFEAKMVNITYKNTGSSFNKSKHIGIIIEDAESLASRNNCLVLTNKVINIDSLHRAQEKITSLFQYIIGNADWSYMMGRNMELVKQADGLIIPIPYDFDYAGLVRAPYARANAALGQKTVLDRVYLGNAKSYEELQSTISYFKTKKDELLAVIDGFEEISRAEAEEMKAFLIGSFEIIENRDRVEWEMLKIAK